MSPRRTSALLSLVLLSGCAAGDETAQTQEPHRVADGPRAEVGRIVAVTDGDTLRVRVGDEVERVRLLGIDAPEASDTRTGAPQCGGREATQAAALLARRFQEVRLVADPGQDRRDRFGRLLAYVEPVAGGATLQERLLEAGWARVYVYGRDPFARLDDFRAAARDAERRNAGVHRVCGGRFDRPA